MSKQLMDIPDEQIVIEWRRRHPISVIAYRSTDPLNPAVYITAGKDMVGGRILCTAISSLMEADYEQWLLNECPVAELETVIDEDEDDDDE